MRFFLLILFPIFFTISCGQTNHSITSTGIGSFKIGGSLESIKNNLKGYQEVKYDGYTYFLIDDEVHLICWTNGESDTIRGLGTQSNKYTLSNGLKVGSSITDILKHYPNIELEYSLESEELYFAPEELVRNINDKEVVIALYVMGKDGEELDSSFNAGTKTTNFSEAGEITRIEVYSWN